MPNAVTGRRNIHDEANEILEILDRPDPNAAARTAAQLVQQAREAGGGGLRQQYLAEAQRHLARMDPRKHAREIHHLQGQILALQGRGGDTRIAHVTPHEMVIPLAMQTPEFVQIAAQYARRVGIDPHTLVVGNPRGNINPRTGHQEFAPQVHIDGGSFAPDIGSVEVVDRRDYGTGSGDFYPGDRGGGELGGGREVGDGIENIVVTAQRPSVLESLQNPPPLIDPGVLEIPRLNPKVLYPDSGLDDLQKKRNAVRWAQSADQWALAGYPFVDKYLPLKPPYDKIKKWIPSALTFGNAGLGNVLDSYDRDIAEYKRHQRGEE